MLILVPKMLLLLLQADNTLGRWFQLVPAIISKEITLAMLHSTFSEYVSINFQLSIKAYPTSMSRSVMLWFDLPSALALKILNCKNSTNRLIIDSRIGTYALIFLIYKTPHITSECWMCKKEWNR